MSRVHGGAPMAHQLGRIFAVLVVMLAVVGVTGMVALSVVTSKVDRLSRVLTPAVESNALALQLMVDAQTGMRGYQLTGDPAFLAPYTQATVAVDATLAETQALARQAGVAVDVATTREAARAWLGEFGPSSAGIAPAVDIASSTAADVAFEEFRSAQKATADALVAARAKLRSQTQQLRTDGAVGLPVLLALCTLLAVLTARGGVQAVERPLLQLRDVLERLRMGEHSARVPMQGPAEVRAVARAANALADEGDRLRAEQQEAARMRRTAQEASRRVRNELDRASVLATAAAALGRALEADRAWIRGVGTDGSAAQWYRSGLARLTTLPKPSADGIAMAHRLWREGEVHAVPNVLVADPADLVDAPAILEVVPEATAFVVAPVGGNDDVIAVAVLAFEHPRELSPDEVRALEWVCADLGRALEHSQLFEQQLELVDRLQELDKQKTNFLSTVSHELRTPLTSISGYAEMLADGAAGPITPQMAEMVQVIERNTQRLRALIEDLLRLSRIESGALRATTAPVHLPDVVTSAVRVLRPQAEAAGVELSLTGGGDDLVVRGDEMQLERVLLNLVSNALKFTPSPGRVVVDLSADGPHAVLTVKDTGIGIPAGEQEQLFSRFFRASNAVDRAFPGTGLGLAIVRSIVEQHGGRLALTSTPGEGTEVRVHLPLLERVPGEQVGDGQRFD